MRALWGAHRCIVHRLPEIIGKGPYIRPITFLQTGAGTGALGIAIVQWCRSRQIPVQYHGIEFHPAAVEIGHTRTEKYNEIKIDLGSPEAPPSPPQNSSAHYDIVIASHFLHEYERPAIQLHIRYLYSLARHTLVIGETVKDPWPYNILRFGLYLTGCSSYVRQRLSESVLRGETVQGWTQLLEETGIHGAEFFLRWPGLICMIAPKLAEDSQKSLATNASMVSVAPT